MIKDFILKDNEEEKLLQFPQIIEYLEKLEELNPNILEETTSKVFKNKKMTLKYSEFKIFIELKLDLPFMPSFKIKVYDKNNIIQEQITFIRETIFNKDNFTVLIGHYELNHQKEFSTITVNDYEYKDNQLQSSKKKIIKTNQNEIEQIYLDKFTSLPYDYKHYYYNKCKYTDEQVLNIIKGEMDLITISEKLVKQNQKEEKETTAESKIKLLKVL